ncbi:Ribosomal large subunit pseudouridine synthase D [Anatilimnocola aggregata]|uniref:Pseudouridine synthase n=1 Tax=Anatilimnocola aggregata TaxID=2528021 RepID=A0A517YM27_9BACT|nr:RluA family pseudouridine synthase [Anatilimnocola aggregata]QDU31278.1 Ribosomal large subunit pseudouridine synthase D [Anatilimnocola aggregata]
MPATVKHLEVDEESPYVGDRADRAVQTLCGLSRSQVNGLFDHQCVKVNGLMCDDASRRLMAGDRIELTYHAGQRYHPMNKPRKNLGFEIVFEDRHLIIVNKPAQLLTVPTKKGETNTLLDKVSNYARHVGHVRAAFNAHRLDRGVSGLLAFGKSMEISQAIRDQFALHKPEREYVAIVAGHMKPQAGTMKSLLATDRDLNRFSTDDEEVGQLAITHFKVAEHLHDTTVMSIWLETGRRNQIRVHFAEQGHPVLGDPRYEPETAAHRHWANTRIALHARKLGFEHPETGEMLKFEVPLPEEMIRFINGQKAVLKRK